MTIKSSKSVRILILIIQLTLVCLSVFLFLSFKRVPIEAHISVFLIFQLYMFRLHLIYGRTLKIDADGCTVKFMFFKRVYKWSELKTKRVEDYRQRMGRNDPYLKGVVFSKKENFRIPQSVGILLYLSFCLNPLRFFFVLYNPLTKNEFKVYEVDEGEFLDKMKEYGVVLDDRYNYNVQY